MQPLFARHNGVSIPDRPVTRMSYDIFNSLQIAFISSSVKVS